MDTDQEEDKGNNLCSLCQEYCSENPHLSNISLSRASLFFPSTFTGKLVLGRNSVWEYFFDNCFSCLL